MPESPAGVKAIPADSHRSGHIFCACKRVTPPSPPSRTLAHHPAILYTASPWILCSKSAHKRRILHRLHNKPTALQSRQATELETRSSLAPPLAHLGQHGYNHDNPATCE